MRYISLRDLLPAARTGGAALLAFLLGSSAACQKDPPVAPVSPAAAQVAAPATPAEPEWKTLFDGQSLTGWHVFKKTGAPENWGVQDGTLAWLGKGGDLVTDEEYTDFELELEWKISEGGNSGIMYRVSEDEDFPWRTGPEMQVLDDSRHPDGKKPVTSSGANYALHPPAEAAVKPTGEWNQIRLLVRGDHVEHWVNGKKVVEYTLWNDQWKQMVAASKFKSMPRYGLNKSGHIVLQDHGDPVWYRNVRIRRL